MPAVANRAEADAVVPILRRAAVPRLGCGGSPQPIAGLFVVVQEALTRTTALVCQVTTLQRRPRASRHSSHRIAGSSTR
jgi:hypothetical protein